MRAAFRAGALRPAALLVWTAFCAARPRAPVLWRRAARLACCLSAACDAACRSSRLSACRLAGCSPAHRRVLPTCAAARRVLSVVCAAARDSTPSFTSADAPHSGERLLPRACSVLALPDIVDLLAHECRVWVLEDCPLASGATRACPRLPLGQCGVLLLPGPCSLRPGGAHPPTATSQRFHGSALRPLVRTPTAPITVESRTEAGSLQERDWWRASPR
jgi:hypothetical protein